MFFFYNYISFFKKIFRKADIRLYTELDIIRPDNEFDHSDLMLPKPWRLFRASPYAAWEWWSNWYGWFIGHAVTPQPHG